MRSLLRMIPFNRHSLRWRLPLIVSTLIAVVLGTFLWAAYRRVELTLVHAAGERAQGAADQVASMLDAQRSTDQLRQLSTDSDLRRFLLMRTEEARLSAKKRMTALAPTPL